MVLLSRGQAVALSKDLGELVVRLQCLQLKYGVEDDLEEGPSFAPLLGALRPFAVDPQVAAAVQSAGFTLSPPTSKLGAVAGRARQVSEDASTSLDTSSAWHSRATTEESVPPFGGTMAAEQEHATVAPSPRALRKVSLVPVLSARAEQWTFVLEHRPEATVGEVRRQLVKLMRQPMGKVRLLARQGEGLAVLQDCEEAARADRVTICNASSGRAEPISRCDALSLQQEILAGLGADGVRPPHDVDQLELIKKVQASVLPKYGFSGGPAGIMRMLQAFDQFTGDEELGKVGEAINDKLGQPPQIYRIYGTPPDGHQQQTGSTTVEVRDPQDSA